MIFANAASMMRDEQPRVNKWCCSIPVQATLRTVAYIKMTTGFIMMFSITLPVFFNGFDRHIFGGKTTYPLLGVLITVIVVDIGFQMSSIVGVHKKSYNTLRVFYFYEIYAITTDIVLTPVILYMTNTERINVDVTKTVIILIVGLFYILLDAGLVRQVKKEIMKIHHKYELSSLHE